MTLSNSDNDNEKKYEVEQIDEWERHRRRYYIITATLRMFASGAETTVIAPSAWFYLKQFRVNHSFFGFLNASYQISSIIAGFVTGRLYDRTRRTKLLALIANFAELIGNIIYSLGFSQYLLLLGRFICGFGEGFVVLVYAEVGSVIPSEDKLKTIAFMEGGRIVGSVVGPILNFGFMDINISIGSWHITYGSAAGLVMAIFWGMIQILTFFFIYDMFRENRIEKRGKDEKVDLLRKETCDEAVDGKCEDAKNTKGSLRESVNELLSVEVLAVAAADFLFWLSFGAWVTLLPVLLVEDLHWGKGPVAGLYIGITVLFIISLGVMSYLPPINHVTVLITCCIVQSLLEGLKIIYQHERPNKQTMLIIMFVLVTMYSLFASASVVVGRTLITKLVTVKSQGLLQGAYTIWVAIASMIGSPTGSSVLYHLDTWGSLGIAYFIFAALLLKFYKKRIDARMAYIEDLSLKKDKQPAPD